MLDITSITFFLRYAMGIHSISVRHVGRSPKEGNCGGVFIFPSGGMFKDISFLKICSPGVLNILLPHAEGRKSWVCVTCYHNKNEKWISDVMQRLERQKCHCKLLFQGQFKKF